MCVERTWRMETNGDPEAISSGADGDQEAMWSDFKTTVLTVAGKCIPSRPRKSDFTVTRETVSVIEESRQARLDGVSELSRKLQAVNAADGRILTDAPDVMTR